MSPPPHPVDMESSLSLAMLQWARSFQVIHSSVDHHKTKTEQTLNKPEAGHTARSLAQARPEAARTEPKAAKTNQKQPMNHQRTRTLPSDLVRPQLLRRMDPFGLFSHPGACRCASSAPLSWHPSQPISSAWRIQFPLPCSHGPGAFRWSTVLLITTNPDQQQPRQTRSCPYSTRSSPDETQSCSDKPTSAHAPPTHTHTAPRPSLPTTPTQAESFRIVCPA